MSAAKSTNADGSGHESRADLEQPSTRDTVSASTRAGSGTDPSGVRASVEREAMTAYTGTKGNPQALTPDGILALQRTIGNAAVNRLLRHGANPEMHAPIQRKVRLRQMNGEFSTPTVEQIVTWLNIGTFQITKGSVEEDTIKFMHATDALLTFNWGYDQRLFMAELRSRRENLDAEHRSWLDDERKRLMQTHGQLLTYLPFLFHEEALQQDMFSHYNFDDNNMLWRFTSLPSQESIVIGAGTTYEEILRVTANHSGGNDKSNENVKTLSFGRNIVLQREMPQPLWRTTEIYCFGSTFLRRLPGEAISVLEEHRRS